ncbi:MAG: hypothetical protein HYX67_04320 [Candidatus Melainabacteria bacterium]|nr:hypothetical protein [Candidatus Melainabacteria bacterium]
MSEIPHGDKPTNNSSDPSPHSLGEYLLASLNPVEQFKIAQAAVSSPGFFGKHPEDALLPMVLLDVAALRGVDTVSKVGGDVINVGKDGFDWGKHGLAQVRDGGKVALDVLTLDFPDAIKDGRNFYEDTVNLFKDEYHMLRDAAQIVPDLFGPVVGGVWNAGKDLVGAGWNVVKDEYESVKDSIHVVGDGLGVVRDVGKTALDVVTLDFPDVYEDGKHAVGHAVDMVKDEVSSIKHGIVDPVKHVVGGVVGAIADLF